jgi:hypothetical protein
MFKVFMGKLLLIAASSIVTKFASAQQASAQEPLIGAGRQRGRCVSAQHQCRRLYRRIAPSPMGTTTVS